MKLRKIPKVFMFLIKLFGQPSTFWGMKSEYKGYVIGRTFYTSEKIYE